MTHNLIKTEHYLLIVNDSKPRKSAWCVEGDFIGKVRDYDNNQESYDCWIGDSLNGYATYYDNCKKIIAHLPLNDAPILEGVDLLPKTESQVALEKLAELPVVFECISQQDGVWSGNYIY
jgi:hypothetical protein